MPGLSFDAAARSLTGTPTAAGSYAMSYTATDADGDLHTLHFNIEVVAGDADDHGGTIRRLTDHDYTDRYPSWSPDGQRIAFDSNRDGNFEVYVMDADGGNPRRLTDHEAYDGSPSWSPDGRRIAFHSLRDGNFEVYVMDADGGNPRRLTDHEAYDGSPSWSPDGRRIAFHSLRDGNFEVYVMDADGGNPRRLTDHDAIDGSPSWSPDGQSIAFRSNRDGNYEVYVMTADGDGTGQDPQPRFAAGSGPGNQTYIVGTAIPALTLPAGGGGDGPRTYSLSPEIPGLIFDATANVRELTGAPSSAGTYDMTYRVRDTDGDTDSLTFIVTVREPGPQPDLVVESASVSDSSPAAGASITLRATVRNIGDASAASTTLRYYRSRNATISRNDTAVGTDPVGALAASGTSAASISLTAPSSAGAYYYGACVDAVAVESDTGNNCSSGVRVEVGGGVSPPPSGSYTRLDRWWLFRSGFVNFVALTIGPGGCANVNGASLNGVVYVVHSTRWQRRASAATRWEDVPGTFRLGRVCSYIPTASGEYRMVGDITVGGTRGNYSSDTITVQ